MKLNYLLVFLPIILVLDWCEASPFLVFATSGLSIVPLAGIMGQATENLSVYLGSTLGSMLNAMFGNAPSCPLRYGG